MLVHELSIDRPLDYHFTGKFESPDSQWKHEEILLDDYELFLVTAGTLYIEYCEKRYEVNKDEILLLPPVSLNPAKRNGYKTSYCAFYWLHFNCGTPPVSYRFDGTLQSQGSALNRNKLLLPNRLRLTQSGKVIILLKQLQDAVRLNYHPVILNYMTTSILCEVYQQFIQQISNVTVERKPKDQLYHDIVDYINRNIHQKLTVAQIADKFEYNEKYLTHMFGEMSGMTLKQFILKTKVNEANLLLTDTNMQISEIAAALGYNDSHNFMKCYKKIVGLTPTEYRNAFSRRMLFDA